MNSNYDPLTAPMTGERQPPAPTTKARQGPTEVPFAPRLHEPRPRSSGWLTLWWTVLDYLRGLAAFRRIGPCVTVFGSARTRPTDPDYQLARAVGAAVARLGFTVMTGGGPGIMEAANRGAKEVGGRSVGCNIELPSRQSSNSYLDRGVTLRLFSVRKALLERYAYAFVVFPGGTGTLNELFDALGLMQSGKMEPLPVMLMRTEYWHEIVAFRETMAQVGAISPGDLSLLHLSDSVQEVIACLRRHAIEPFGLRLVSGRARTSLAEGLGWRRSGIRTVQTWQAGLPNQTAS